MADTPFFHFTQPLSSTVNIIKPKSSRSTRGWPTRKSQRS